MLFTRGETQALCVATLGSRTDALRAESIRDNGDDLGGERFYLQYHFPPSSVGEVGRVGGPGRLGMRLHKLIRICGELAGRMFGG